MKAPQAINIAKSGSIAGLDASAMYLDVLVFLTTTATSYLYGYDFAEYGESVAILLQNVGLVMMLWYFGGSKFTFGHKVQVVLFGILWMVPLVYLRVAGGDNWQAATDIQPEWLPVSVKEFPTWMQATGIPLGAMSRLLQVWANFWQGHTGQLAIVTLLLNFAGSIARIFTSIQAEMAMVYVVGFCSGATTGAILLLQIFWYWSATNKYLAEEAKKREAAKQKKE